ncbi:Pleckstrin y domain-containing family G member 7 [Orchesella cincta]|uniref:Pleckstrin y domain-containing family G member 7 n=1 Tax=Orchesella cincta TaxID=48709 RepID=A0A1D2NFY0_ORCCI|nr:Pleckstrin y domain-containing family G member 7 [Orchesella cincta]
MSDRCLERRITPALFRGTQGFLGGEKLVEGKETEPSKPFPLVPVKSEKDLLTNVTSTENTTSGGGSSIPQQPPPEESISDPDVRQKMRQKEALWDLFQSECSFLYDHLMVLKNLCMKDPRCKKLQLTDLLVSPVQHIMKVPLILKDIQSRTNEPQEKELISQILEIQENSILHACRVPLSQSIGVKELYVKTWVPEFLRVALSRQPCDSIIVSPRRQIIHEGLLQLWDTGKPTETYVILFDDMLLITRRKKGLSKKEINVLFTTHYFIYVVVHIVKLIVSPVFTLFPHRFCQKSSLTENWQSACGKSGSVVGSGLETNHRYIVYRQPISLDRFFIHDIAEAENTSAKLDYAFVLVALNRFQQIVAVHTFQAPSDQVKVRSLSKLFYFIFTPTLCFFTRCFFVDVGWELNAEAISTMQLYLVTTS